MSKHEGFTPGPWGVVQGTTIYGGPMDYYVAEVQDNNGSDTNAANARLIADAPRLYEENRRLSEAMERVAYALEQDGRTADGCTKLDAAARIRAALKGD